MTCLGSCQQLEDHGDIEDSGNGSDDVDDSDAMKIWMGSGEVDGGGREESKVWRSWLNLWSQWSRCHKSLGPSRVQLNDYLQVTRLTIIHNEGS
jgi:hypothetical protein